MTFEFARVTTVSTKESKVFVSCQPPRPGVEYRDIPFMKPFPGGMITPSEGDIVAVYKLEDGGRIATFAPSTPAFSMPDLGENELVFRFDDSTEIRIQKNASDTYDVTINASGNITIGDAANAVELAVQNHTHNYTWTDGAGSGTTDPPNETGTSTTVE